MHKRVFFDDLKVTHHQSTVVQSNNYYPFGLQHNTSWTRSTERKNNRLYNAGSELNEQTKNYETFYRDYDPALGRFNQIDPLASKYSSLTPYNFGFNDPVFWNDPSGADPWDDFWAAVYAQLEDLGSSGATSWTSGGGWTDVQGGGFNAGADYNTQHNSWGNTYFQNEGASYIAMDAMNHGASWEQAVTIVEGSGFEEDGFTFLNEVIVTATSTSVAQNGGDPLRIRIYSPMLSDKIANATSPEEAIRIATYGSTNAFVNANGEKSSWAERQFRKLHPASLIKFPAGGSAVDVSPGASGFGQDIVFQGLNFETGQFQDIYTLPYWNQDRKDAIGNVGIGIFNMLYFIITKQSLDPFVSGVPIYLPDENKIY